VGGLGWEDQVEGEVEDCHTRITCVLHV
jgi:hypothetical protein